MPAEPVPVTTSIRRSKVGNMDTERLQARHAHLDTMLTADGMRENFESLHAAVDRARERKAISEELGRRHPQYSPTAE